MRITIAAVGRAKAGPERDLTSRYLDRAAQAGRRLGLTFTVREFTDSRAATAPTRMKQEADAILASLSADDVLVALDRTGTDLGSRAFANRLADWRRDGVANVVFAIGGTDGHGTALMQRAALRLAFGAPTWPHQLARVMLAEQLYRAVTILTGHPYHRGR